MKPALAFIALLALAGCASGDSDGLKEIVLEDVQNARMMAERSGDRLGTMCWTYLEQVAVDRLPSAERPEGEVVGALSAYQKARNVRLLVSALRRSEELRVQCGPMISDSTSVLRRLGLRAASPF